MREHRKHVRIPSCTGITLNWIEGGIQRSMQTIGIDISAGGMRVNASGPVPRLTDVTFVIPDADAAGVARVIYASHGATGFIVGLEFNEQTRRDLFAYSNETVAA